MFCEPRIFLAASGTLAASPGHPRNSSGDVELTFLRHPFESLGRIFDPVLAVVAIGREQLDHLIGAAGGRTGNVAGREIDGLSITQKCRPCSRSPLTLADWKTGENIAQREPPWPVTSGHGKCADFAGFS